MRWEWRQKKAKTGNLELFTTIFDVNANMEPYFWGIFHNAIQYHLMELGQLGTVSDRVCHISTRFFSQQKSKTKQIIAKRRFSHRNYEPPTVSSEDGLYDGLNRAICSHQSAAWTYPIE